MFEELGKILVTLDNILTQMKRSNKNMENLTKQLEILTLPPNMAKWANKRTNRRKNKNDV